MKLIDLFSGIGGFSLAAHWMGWETIAFVERDEFCQKVLRKNFGNDIFLHDDITTFSGKSFRGKCDIVTGGFPCKDISIVNVGGVGLEGEHSGLWKPMRRVINEVRPSWVVVENVAHFVKLGLDAVLFDLENLGYSAKAIGVPACAVAAPHERERIWVIANLSELVVRERQFAGSLAQTTSEAKSGRQRDFFNADTFHNRGTWRESWVENAVRTCVRSVDDGLSRGLDKYRKPALRAYGNTIVPQIAFRVFTAIEQAEHF